MSRTVAEACRFYEVDSILDELEELIIQIGQTSGNDRLLKAFDDMRYSISVLMGHPGAMEDENPREIMASAFSMVMMLDKIRAKETSLNPETRQMLSRASVTLTPLDSMFAAVV